MSEGSGLSMYVIIGVIFFGLFALIAILFKDQLSQAMENLINDAKQKVSDWASISL